MGCGTNKSLEEKPNIPPSQKTKIIENYNTNEKQKQNQNSNVILNVNSKPKSKRDLFIEIALNKHNEYRSLHGVEPLTISEKINNIAQKYAEHLASINKMVHSNNENYGENLYWCMGRQINGADMTNSWYEEIHTYDFNIPVFKSDSGHFTQVIWKESKKVGFGFAKSKDGGYFGVANYYPAGNIDSPEDFKENVLRKKT